jgi:valyl-tRNA synthetase
MLLLIPFGTGAVKVTPAHEMIMKWGKGITLVINIPRKCSDKWECSRNLRNIDRFEARKSYK